MKEFIKRLKYCYGHSWKQSRRTRILSNIWSDLWGGLVMGMSGLLCIALIPFIIVKDFVYFPFAAALFRRKDVERLMKASLDNSAGGLS